MTRGNYQVLWRVECKVEDVPYLRQLSDSQLPFSFTMVFCFTTSGPAQKHRSECWAKINQCGPWMLSTLSEWMADFYCCLHYRQNKFKQRPLGALARAGLLYLGTSHGYLMACFQLGTAAATLLLCKGFIQFFRKKKKCFNDKRNFWLKWSDSSLNNHQSIGREP